MAGDFKNILKWIDEQQAEIISFCCEGINQISLTGAELPFQKWFAAQCRKAGFDKVDQWAVDEAQVRPNLVSTLKGTGGGRSLILNGHSDVVPVVPEELPLWDTNPWQGTLKDGKIWGRGAVDMKGGLTAMYFAARAIRENGVKLRGDVFLESVVGEELCEHFLGTTATIERGYTAPFAIVLEPTNCELQIKSPGAITWELNVKGRSVHNAQANKVKYPQPYGIAAAQERGVDAFKKALKILAAFENLEEQWNFRWRDRILGGGGYPGKDHNGVGIFTIVPAIIQAGDYIVAVPGFAKIQGGLSYAPWVPFEEIEQELRQVIDSVTRQDDWLKENPPEFKIFYDWPGYICEDNHPGCQCLAKAYRDITGFAPLFTGFPAVNDASFLAKKNIPAISFGPGAISNNAHGNNEYLQVDQLILSIKILSKMIMDWCG